MNDRKITVTGDLADAIGRTDARQLQLQLTVVLLFGALTIVALSSLELRAARKRERAEFGFALDTAAAAVQTARTIRVDRAGEATRGEDETPPPAE